MNEQVLKLLKQNIRTTEQDLSTARINQKRGQEYLNEANKMVQILEEGLKLLKMQLESLNERA